ncbi:hypothetical protein NVP1031O_053 [Vibrio phage 1.031.O._10N.261.46.F8]|nr:hypothetical protein NVP1031O_053 [Vibrio phage 1.031.O._10N.261.46.F8]
MRKLVCNGGPYHGSTIQIKSGIKSLTFTAKGMTGYYEEYQCPSYLRKDRRYEWHRTGISKERADMNYIFCR